MGPKKIGAMGRNFAIESSRQARICGAMRQIFCGGINVQIFRHTVLDVDQLFVVDGVPCIYLFVSQGPLVSGNLEKYSSRNSPGRPLQDGNYSPLVGSNFSWHCRPPYNPKRN